MELLVGSIELPIPADGGWGYGANPVPLPGTHQVLLSLPSGGPRSPWCVVDVITGQLRRGKGLPGASRAAVVLDGQEDRPWVLATHGLARVDLSGPLQVLSTARKGIGAYASVLLDVGAGLLAIAQGGAPTTLLVDAHDGSVVTRVRVGSSAASYPLADGRFRLLGGHHEQAGDLDPHARRITARHPFPLTDSVVRAGDLLIALTGPRPAADPGGAQPGPHGGTASGRRVQPDTILVIDATTLQTRAAVPAPPDSLGLLGVDGAGRPVVAIPGGFAVVDLAVPAVVARYDRLVAPEGAAYLPGLDMVALVGGRRTQDKLTVVAWR